MYMSVEIRDIHVFVFYIVWESRSKTSDFHILMYFTAIKLGMVQSMIQRKKCW